MGDAVDILNLERPTKPALHRILYGSSLNAGVAKKAPSKSDSKHSSLHREMRLLSGSVGFHAEELTTLVPTETLSFKQSRRREGAAGKWLWQKFTNSARSDQLELFHWQKSTVVLDDYHFAKFNKPLGPRDFVMYTDEEYAQHFVDSSWTRDDTDEMMMLAKRFDLRFQVVADRMRSARNVEDIKARFYSIMRKLLEERNLLESTPENILFCRPFDKSYELERKRQLETIFARDPSVAIQEEKLMEEARKIQALLKKKNEEMRRHLMEQSTADQDRLRRQNINARLLQPGSVSLRSSLIHSMCAESSGHPRVDAKVNAVIKELRCDNPMATAACSATYMDLRNDVRHLVHWQVALARKHYEYEKLRARRADLMRSMKKVVPKTPTPAPAPAEEKETPRHVKRPKHEK